MKTRKVALVTGALRGIGLGISRCLLQQGYSLAAGGVREESEVSQTLAELRKENEVLYFQFDLANAEARNQFLQKVRSQFGQLNVLVNNAGIAPLERSDILEATEESFESVIKVNLQGPYFLTQSVARWMIEQKQERTDFSGCIINISSVSATVASITRGEYCISKAGLSMATQLWAVRLGERDIPVYEIQPGLILTDMTAPARKRYNELISQGLLLQSRWGTPEDVGQAVGCLVRGDLPYSTGQVLRVDGGLTVKRV